MSRFRATGGSEKFGKTHQSRSYFYNRKRANLKPMVRTTKVWIVVLVDVDLRYSTLTVEYIVAFTTIFSIICTVHAQKRLFPNFRCKFRHRRSIRRPQFPIRVQMSAIWRRFPFILAFYMPNVRHISTSGLYDLLT